MSEQPSPQYPSPRLWPLRRVRTQPLQFLESLASCGDVVPFAIGGRRAFLVNKAEYAEEVLVTRASAFAKGPANSRSKRLLGNGLLTAEGAYHASRRRLVQPAFARRRLDEAADIVASRAESAAAGWRDGAQVELTRAMGELTFGIVGQAIIGAPVDRFYEDVRDAVQEVTATLDALVSLVAPLRRVSRPRQRLMALVDCLLSEHRPSADACSLLSLLVSASDNPRQDDQVREDLLTMLLAGHDTISNALCWTWLLLASHSRVEDVLVAELRRVLNGRLPSAGDVPALTFTRSVLSESLRLYPPAWVLARCAVEDYRFGDNVVPADSIVLVSQYLMHRDERYFADAAMFRPERWLENDGGRPRLAYFPFGAGLRSCIGESFAWMEGVVILATIAQRSRLVPEQGFPSMDPRITMRPRGAVPVRVEQR